MGVNNVRIRVRITSFKDKDKSHEYKGLNKSHSSGTQADYSSVLCLLYTYMRVRVCVYYISVRLYGMILYEECRSKFLNKRPL